MFQAKFIKHFNQTIDIKNVTVYLAISGGVDSMVLSKLLSILKIKHTLLHCNFNLRRHESDEDEAFLLDYANKNNIKLQVKHFDTSNIAKQQKLTIQECARNLRYDWFNTYLNEANSILLTAHHLDDSIETFFINILRGTGLKGISGIGSGKNKIFRPLLPFSKEEVKNYAIENQIAFREDSSNKSDNYLRNDLRHNFVPQFKSLTTSLNAKMASLFDELTETELFISSITQKYKTDLNINSKILIDQINELPEKQKTALILKTIEGMTLKEIAVVMKASEKSIESLLSRSRSNLKKKRNKSEGFRV